MSISDPALLSLSQRKAMFERNKSVPTPVARFGESVTPAMLQKAKHDTASFTPPAEAGWRRKKASSPTAVMTVQTPNKQRNSFAPLCNSSMLPAFNIHEQRGVGIHSNDIHSEYISLAWHNMASIKSARKLSREANRNAKQYYTLAFLDDEDPEEHSRGVQNTEVKEEDNTAESEENDSVHNSKFAFDDDEAWLGSRKKSFIAEITESGRKDELDAKPRKVAAKANVIGLFLSQS